jgi:hypothetical protein
MKRTGTKKPSQRRQPQPKPNLPISVVTCEGKTTIRQFKGRRFVRFGEFRGKRVAWVEFYTCGPNYHSISVHFQDRTVLYLKITPMFTVKPEYCSLKASDLEIIQEWPEIANEK